MIARHIKNVLILGGGLAGSALALALAKRDIPVTILDASYSQRHYPAPLTIADSEPHVDFLKHPDNCPRAIEQIIAFSRKSTEELLLSLPCTDVYKVIQEQLKSLTHVECVNHYSALELITLEKHSLKKNDVHKRPSCVGVYALNNTTKEIEPILAREIILANGGAASLFLHSNRAAHAKGTGLAMAYRAGARLNFNGPIQFSPLNVYIKSQPCFPIPLELLKMGGKILNSQRNGLTLSENLTLQLYQELCRSEEENLWLDITSIDPGLVRESYPSFEAYCLNHGINSSKEFIPIVPAAHHVPGGVVIDRCGQTSLNRLRAIGEVSSLGLYHPLKNDGTLAMEVFAWAVSCAEDISKQIGKLAYYFPEVSEWTHESCSDSATLMEDANLLKRIMWSYVGINSNSAHHQRAQALLHELMRPYREKREALSGEEFQFMNTLQAALLLAQY